MRVVLILATLIPLLVVTGWFLSRPVLAARKRREHIAQLEAENERLDTLLQREHEAQDRPSS
jgi:cell division protein FtsB